MKLAKRIGVLGSIRHYLPLNESILFYNATIKPLFLYGGVVWRITSKANIRGVFRLQKRAARVILEVKTANEERNVDLFNKLDWLPFYDEINVNKLCLIFKCLHGQCPEYLSNKLIRVSDKSVRSSRYSHITLRCPIKATGRLKKEKNLSLLQLYYGILYPLTLDPVKTLMLLKRNTFNI